MTEQAVPILMYHSVSNHAQTTFAPYCVTPDQFRKQIAWLAEQGYQAITVNRLVEAVLTGSGLANRPILITFDDGFLDFYTDALPVLAEYHFPATLFVATSYVGKTSSWLKNEREEDRPMLHWDQLDEIARSGIECGGHSHSHAALDRLARMQVQSEIRLCKDLLEDHLGRQVTSFAYPFGYYDRSIKTIIREAGYRGACAVRHSVSFIGDDLYALRRLMVSRDMDLDQFAGLVSHQSSKWARAVRDIRETAATFLRRNNLFPGAQYSSDGTNHD